MERSSYIVSTGPEDMSGRQRQSLRIGSALSLNPYSHRCLVDWFGSPGCHSLISCPGSEEHRKKHLHIGMEEGHLMLLVVRVRSFSLGASHLTVPPPGLAMINRSDLLLVSDTIYSFVGQLALCRIHLKGLVCCLHKAASKKMLCCSSFLLRDEKLLGKAAFERILDIAFATSLCRIFQHTLTEFDKSFIDNVWAESSQVGLFFLLSKISWCKGHLPLYILPGSCFFLF